MSPSERQAREAAADRAKKRGDLAEAVAHLRAILEAAPGDDALAQRVAVLEESLSPAERSRAARPVPLPVASAPPPATPVAEAEALADHGDLSGAIARYRALLDEQPDNELLKERLAELFRLAQVQAPRRLTPAPQPEAVLSDLLTRISSRRRG